VFISEHVEARVSTVLGIAEGLFSHVRQSLRGISPARFP
jgi:hypothetical protein